VIELAIPPRYDGRPVPLRRIETRAIKEGLLADLAREPALDLRTLAFQERAGDLKLLRAIVARLLAHFSDEVLDERFLLEIMPPGLAPPDFLGGFNIGPLCASPDGPPPSVLRTWLHELGHAMFPTEDRLDAETAALLVEIVFWTKLETELPQLVFFGSSLTFLEGGEALYRNAFRAAHELLARGVGPELGRYGLDDEARLRFSPGNFLRWG
jgi:hypothetical protein